MELRNKHILITGGSSGVGYALSQQLVKKGCSVHCWDKDMPKEPVEKVFYTEVDVTKSDDIRCGCFFLPNTIDVVVNNAGIIRRGTVFESNEEEFDSLFSVNVKGSWLVLKKIFEYHPAIGVNAVVQVASMHALNPQKNPALYTLTKQCVVNLAEMVAREYSQVDVKIAFLGHVDTPLARYGRTAGELECVSRHQPSFVAEHLVKLLESDKKKLLFDEVNWNYVLE